MAICGFKMARAVRLLAWLIYRYYRMKLEWVFCFGACPVRDKHAMVESSSFTLSRSPSFSDVRPLFADT